MKRFVFDNLIYKYNDEVFLIMNLISFRRETITKDVLDKLIMIENEINTGKVPPREDENILKHFYEKKQILPTDIVEKVDRQLERESEIHLLKFPAGLSHSI